MESERDRLILTNLPLAKWHASRRSCHSIPGLSYDDLYQAGCIGLIEAADSWNPDFAPFGIWATMNIKGTINEEIDRMRRAIRKPRTVSVEDYLAEIVVEPMTDQADHLDHEPVSDREGQIDDMLSHLQGQSREILALHFGLVDGEPWTTRRIAEKLGVSYTTIENRINMALHLLREIVDSNPQG